MNELYLNSCCLQEQGSNFSRPPLLHLCKKSYIFNQSFVAKHLFDFLGPQLRPVRKMTVLSARINGVVALTSVFILGPFICKTWAACYSPVPVFPAPSVDPNDSIWPAAMNDIERRLKSHARLPSNVNIDEASYAIALTSASAPLWSFHQLGAIAKGKGLEVVDGNSFFRMASVSKVLTVFSLLSQQAAGRLDLDDPITKYIPELGESGSVPKDFVGPKWGHISLRSLASQLSGIYRESPRSSEPYSAFCFIPSICD